MEPQTTVFSYRTDLADETRELLKTSEGKEPDGIEYDSEDKDGTHIERTRINSDIGAKKTGKPIGRYVTISVGKVWLYDGEEFRKICDIVADELRSFIPEKGAVLLAGLGNRRIVADAVGPETSANFIVTRHIKEKSPQLFESFGFRETAAITPGVLGNTGVEAAEIIKGVVKTVCPACLVVVDSLASRRLSRLATTVQICDTGISPGSGVENARSEISRATVGVPVVAIGIPTVVDAMSLALDVIEQGMKKRKGPYDVEKILKGIIAPAEAGYFVTPKETDVIIKDTSRLIGYSLNKAIHKRLDYDEMEDFL